MSVPAAAAAQCPGSIAVQILGSGGPIAEGARAGSSAIIWIDGKAVALIDAGSGAFVRYGEAGVRFEDHRVIALTHFHADHVADLGAILNSGSFSDRSEDLPILGPQGSEYFPGVTEHLKALFDPKSGAFRYLSGFLDGSAGKPRIVPVEIASEGQAQPFIDAETGLTITPIPVQHGVVPALAYRIEVRGKMIVFAGDQNEFSDAFIANLAGRTPDLLIVHNVIPEGQGQPRGLHRPPSSLGTMAAAIDPRLLVLSHNMQRALVRQPEGEAAIRASYAGPMTIADDLACYAL
ncbi:MBL fold metallo-hydrolase [Blastomonas sp. SL216]|uniref:MBL fold metallo-hydrolase n=1 Tax=Blastomonas sp. SL216 TaxID=2995169 RepID=UPI0023773F83|nr:MBL fold metallo-hydrolase [Blastomonas sp. SL216]